MTEPLNYADESAFRECKEELEECKEELVNRTTALNETNGALSKANYDNSRLTNEWDVAIVRYNTLHSKMEDLKLDLACTKRLEDRLTSRVKVLSRTSALLLLATIAAILV